MKIAANISESKAWNVLRPQRVKVRRKYSMKVVAVLLDLTFVILATCIG